MDPTMHNGEKYLLNRWVYHFRTPRRGELVVFKDPDHADLAIKRIVAISGDRIQMAGDVVYVDDARLNLLNVRSADRKFPARVETLSLPKDYYFVLGDNRKDSHDSREFGPIPRSWIVGLVPR